MGGAAKEMRNLHLKLHLEGWRECPGRSGLVELKVQVQCGTGWKGKTLSVFEAPSYSLMCYTGKHSREVRSAVYKTKEHSGSAWDETASTSLVSCFV